MGPRNRRRLVAACLGLTAIAIVVVAVVLLTRPANKSSHGASRRSPFFKAGPGGDKRYAANAGNLVYGMTKRQVLHLVGPPTKKIGSCWQYPLNEAFKIKGTKYVYNAERVCFYEGLYANQSLEMNGTWHPQ